MINWTTVLKEDVIDWLLEESNPSIRYFTLRDILDKNEKDPQVLTAKKNIFSSQIVNKIFQKQNQNGSWEKAFDPYLPKYRASYWQIMTLSRLGLDRTDSRIEKACQHIFQFQQLVGSFTSQTQGTLTKEYETRLKRHKKLPPRDQWISSIIFEQQLSCLTGNMSTALIRLGYERDPHVEKALAWLVDVQNVDGGWLCPYWRAHIRDKHGCFHGSICALEAFSEVKAENRTAKMKKAIERGAEFMLVHRLFKADHHEHKIINPAWLKLSFPWFYEYSILRGLDVLSKLGYANDERQRDAVAILLKKQKDNGVWILEKTPTGRMQVNLEARDRPSKWITLIALTVLKRLSTNFRTA
jgi:hypothetical protein